jgi:hypothetical protein
VAQVSFQLFDPLFQLLLLFWLQVGLDGLVVTFQRSNLSLEKRTQLRYSLFQKRTIGLPDFRGRFWIPIYFAKNPYLLLKLIDRELLLLS